MVHWMLGELEVCSLPPSLGKELEQVICLVEMRCHHCSGVVLLPPYTLFVE